MPVDLCYTLYLLLEKVEENCFGVDPLSITP